MDRDNWFREEGDVKGQERKTNCRAASQRRAGPAESQHKERGTTCTTGWKNFSKETCGIH